MARREPRGEQTRQIYFERVVIGNAVKISAVDADTGTEVSISGPRNTSQKELERIVLQKLMRAMERNAGR